MFANRLSLWLGAVALTALGASGANAATFTFTNDADWDLGVYTSTNSGPPGADHQLQLNPDILTPFDHIWVALSGRGTAVRIDTNFSDPNNRVTLAESAAGNGAVLGEYRTAPQGQPANPSRTTVDQNGDVWVGNRDQSGGGLGSVAKISANPTGTTSTGVWNGANFNVLGWSNAGGADTNGGTSTASDSANLLYVRTAGTNVRTIAVDANNDVWVGGYSDKEHQRLDGTTGVPNSAVVNLGSNSGYGGLIDGNGVLWSAGWGNASLSRYDPATGIETNHAVGGGSYGLAVDTQGNIWNTHLSNGVTKLDSAGNLIATYTYAGGSANRGVTVTPGDDNVWIANSGTNTVSRLDNNGNLLATIVVESGPMGMSVDSNGKVWATNFNSNSVSRIDPTTNLVDLTVELGAGAQPYNYSDMTGTTVTGTTNPTGTWRHVVDGGEDDPNWDQLFWNTEAEGEVPLGTALVIELRAADSLAGLTAATYSSFASGADVSVFDGLQFIEIRATFSGSGVGDEKLTPILSDLSLSTLVEVSEPGTLAVLGAGFLLLVWARRRRVA